MKLDLQKFVAPIAEEIAQRCRDYDAITNDGPGQSGDPIRQITAGFQFDQDAWIALVFDTRPAADAAFDGNWQLHLEENFLDGDFDIDEWLDAYETLFDDEDGSPVTVTSVAGMTETIQPHEEPDDDGQLEERITNRLAELIGESLRDALLVARKNGVFRNLPLSPTCVMRVDEHHRSYCWPDHDLHGTDEDEGRANYCE